MLQGVGGGLNAGVEKTVDGKVLASHNNTLFSYDAPLVERLSPDHSPASGGITVTVLGTNFGQPSDDGAENQQPVVLIGDSKCTGTANELRTPRAPVASQPMTPCHLRVQEIVFACAHLPPSPPKQFFVTQV